jgi:hypothetical protein
MQANSIFCFLRPKRRISSEVPAAAGRGACLQQFIPKPADDEIILLYQLLIYVIKLTLHSSAFGTGPPQIWPHLPALLGRSLLRFAAFAI